MNLIAGATGMLGSLITRGLLSRGVPVRALVRPGTDAAALNGAGVQTVFGDLKEPASLAAACAGVRTVITTANSAGRGGADTIETVERAGNRALIDAARAAGAEHFIFTSALGAALDSPVDFLRAKAEAEQHLRESGMRYTILLPNIFMEVWVGMLVLAPIGQVAPVTLIGKGDHRHAFVSARDVAAFANACVDNPAAANRTLIIVGPDALTWTDVVRVAERVLGRTLEVRYVRPGEPLPGTPPVVAQLAAAFETYETVIDGRPIAAEFGVTLTSVEDFLRRALVPPPDARLSS